MKKILIKILGWFGFTLTSSKAHQRQSLEVINRGKEIIKKISPDFTILNGPFKGIKYPSIDITELTLAPKISGSYEMQLVPVINKIINIPYDNIIDIGCAEGYYAVGLAKKIPGATVHCFDINQYDLDFCASMAKLNGVTNLTFNNFCSTKTLTEFNYGNRSLIFCDCEGYEFELFTDKVIESLKNTDVLLELHDIVNPLISKTLMERFKATHNIQLINNFNLDYSHLAGLENISNGDKAFAVYEHRGGLHQNIFMEWVFLTPKI